MIYQRSQQLRQIFHHIVIFCHSYSLNIWLVLLLLTFYTCVKGVKRSLEVLEYCVKLRVLVPVELPYEGSSLSLNGKQTRISPHLSFLSTCLTCHPWRLSPKRVNQAHGFIVCPLPFPSSPPRTLSSSSPHSTVKATMVVFSLLSLLARDLPHTSFTM